jgi:hypothetical protein
MKTKITILILLCCAINVSAWTDEQNMFTENESLDYGVNEIFNSSTVTNPYWFDESRYLHGDSDILSPYFRSNDQIDFCVSYDICKYVYNPVSGEYVKSACCVNIEDCITAEIYMESDGINYYRYPQNLEQHISDGFLIKKYMQEMMNAGNLDCADYLNIDESQGDNPNVFGINATADVGNDELSVVYTGFVTLTGESETLLSQSPEYGFDTDSVCGEGGAGGFSQQVGWGDIGEAGERGRSTFEIMFYMIIPLLFMILSVQMIMKVIE